MRKSLPRHSREHVYFINMTADQPLSENIIARDGVGGVLIFKRYSNTCLKALGLPA